MIKRRGVSIVVLATPAAAAQEVCDRVVRAGVTSILNFAPVVLAVPDGVDVRKVDLSIELQILAFHEQRKAGGPSVRVADRGAVDERSRAIGAQPPDRSGGPARNASPVSGEARSSCCTTCSRTTSVAEAFVVSTCNRVEVYAAVDRFHAAVTGRHRAAQPPLGRPRGAARPAPLRALRGAGRRAPVLGGVRPGLDGRGRGPDPRPGPLRAQARPGSSGTVGATLNELVQQALRVGKRAHTETGIDRAGASLVGVGPRARRRELGPSGGAPW